MGKTYVVVGGGVAGMYASHLLKKNNPNSQVVLLERGQKLGGLLQSFVYDKNINFDIGVHTFYETGHEEIDNFFFSILPSGWKFLTGYQRDLGGSWHNGTIQYETPYLNLINCKKEEKDKYFIDFFSNINNLPNLNNDCISYSTARYGKVITESFIRPAI